MCLVDQEYGTGGTPDSLQSIFHSRELLHASLGDGFRTQNSCDRVLRNAIAATHIAYNKSTKVEYC